MLCRTLLIAAAAAAFAIMPASASAASASVSTQQVGAFTGLTVASGDELVASVSPDFSVCGGFNNPDTSQPFCHFGWIAGWWDVVDQAQYFLPTHLTGGAHYKIGDGPWVTFTASGPESSVSTPEFAYASGPLYLTTNDRYWTNYGYGDNQGSITVTVTSPGKDACKQNDWKQFMVEGVPFKNQGDCVSYVATKGGNGAAG